MMFPYLAVSFTAIFWFLPHKCSQFCSLEHNYFKYLPRSSSTLILLGFSKEGLSSWRWPKHILKKASKGSILAGYCNRRLGPTYFVDLCDWDTGALRCTAQNRNLCISETSRGQFPWAQPTCTPEGRLTPRHTGLNLFVFHIIRKTVSLRALIQHSPLHDLDVSSSFLCQTLTIQQWNNPAGWLPGLGWVGCLYS